MPPPPLSFLPAVEAAARLGSFRAAASELHITPSAVSQQIRAVEEALGASLFVRRGRAVVLTPEGQLYCQDVRRALLDLREAHERIARSPGSQVLRLSTTDYLAQEFLIPRLAAFQEEFASVELRIEASMRLVDVRGGEADAALRVRGHPGAGVAREPVGPLIATPVCRPEIAARVREPADLANEALIELRGPGEGSWSAALHRWGARVAKPRVLSFETYLETLVAAERGLGVAFGMFPMTTHWLTAGRLAAPLCQRTPIEGGVYLVFRPQDPRRELLVRIAAWLRAEYGRLPALPDGPVTPRA